ncbi:MAG TPA: DUF6062 family protein [Methylomirabilota bacterium]|nr:DUF6062 family protein [Methylomirabilota bacterium]
MTANGDHRLAEACARPGCPVCGALRDLARRHLAVILAEHVTDPISRARLADAWGFCAAHAAALRKIPEAALGAAIVYHGLVEQACRWLDEAARAMARPAGRGGWRALVGRPRGTRGDARRRRTRCPVCVELVLSEARHLDALLTGLEDGELGAAYAASDGLCLPHLELAVERAGARPQAARLVALTREKLRALAADLRGFVDKHDHRARPSFTEREAGAWQQALALVAGRAELFGPGMERDGAGDAVRRPRARRRP